MQRGRTLFSWGILVFAGLLSWLFAQGPVTQPPVTQPPAAQPPAVPPPVVQPLPAEWQVLEPPGEGFRVEMPGKPESQTSELDTKAGKILVQVFVLADEKRGRTYQVAANHLPAAPTEAEALLNRTRDGAVRAIQGKVLDERRLPHDKHPGRALTVDAGDRFFHVRLYTAGDRLYQLNVASDAQKPTPDDERVLSSFQILDGAPLAAASKLDWRFVTPRGEKLAIDMPGDPQETTGSLDTPLGRVKLTRLECTIANRTYFLQICNWPAALAGDAATRLNAARDHALQATGGKLVEEQPLSVADRPGRTAVIEAGGRTLRLRTLLDGAAVYQLGTVGTGALTEEERRFFESLKLPAADGK